MNSTKDFHPSGLRRRDILQAAAAAATVPLATTRALAQDKLSGRGEVVVFSYGGSYTQAMRKAVYDPFTKATGITVVDVVADIAEPNVKAMKLAGRIDWDVALIDPQNVPPLRETGIFAPIDYGLWNDESLRGVPQAARLGDAVVCFYTAVVLAYDERAFPKGTGPKSWADFWNVKAFPGPRGLNGRSAGHMSLPLAADGMATSDIYPVTEEKLKRAFRKLDEIKPHITKWWLAGGEPVQALLNKEYAMTSCPDGRVLQAILKGAPLQIVWNQCQISPIYYAILRGGPNPSNAQKFLAYANRAQVAASYTQGTNYPSPNVNQLHLLPPNLPPLLSINPANRANVITPDFAWMAAMRSDGKTNYDHVGEQFVAWRARA